jgi:hypothetical protein
MTAIRSNAIRALEATQGIRAILRRLRSWIGQRPNQQIYVGEIRGKLTTTWRV